MATPRALRPRRAKGQVKSGNLHVAIIPNDRLGDAFIYLILAANLNRYGYQISYYSDHVLDMQDWLPNIPVYSTPRDQEALKKILSTRDVVIVDPPLIEGIHLNAKLRERIIELAPTTKCCIAALSLPTDRTIKDGKDSLGIMDLAGKRLAICSKLSSRSMVSCSVEFCDSVLGIPEPSREIGLKVIPGIVKNKHARRIVVFPTSPIKKKEYPRKRFIALLRALNRGGWEPIAAVTPRELEHWSARDLPCQSVTFNSTSEMAKFIYESALVVSNDSGAGHLASALGIPTVTVCNDRKPLPWRPGWAPGRVVRPSLVLKFAGLKIWSPFVSRRKILRSVERLVASSLNKTV